MLGPLTTATGPAYELQLHGFGAEGTRAIFTARGDFRAEAGEWDRLSALYRGAPARASTRQPRRGHCARRRRGRVPGHRSLVVLRRPGEAVRLARRTPDTRRTGSRLLARASRGSRCLCRSCRTTFSARPCGFAPQSCVGSLQHKISLEIVDKRFSLQPSMVEFMTQRLVKAVTERLIEEITSELLSTRLQVFNTHALLKTQSSQHVRATQRRLILRPILDSVSGRLPSGADTATTLDKVLDVLRRDYRGRPTYAAGNILNMLVQLGVDLRGLDFSALCIWQADLEGVNLQDVDFSESRFAKCCFTRDVRYQIHAVAFDAKGEVIAAGDPSGFIHVWRLLDGRLLYRVHAHENWVRRLLFIDDGRQLVSAGDDSHDRSLGCRQRASAAHVRGTHELGERPGLLRSEPSARQRQRGRDGAALEPRRPQRRRVGSVQGGRRRRPLDRVRDRTATSSRAGALMGSSIRWFSCAAGSGRRSKRTGEASTPSSTRRTPVLASGGADGRLRLWDPTSLKERGELVSPGGEIVSLAAHADMQRLASASRDGIVRLWDVGTGRVTQTLQGHTGAVNSIDISTDGRTVLSAGEDQSVRVWTLADGNCVRQLGYVRIVWAVAWSTDGSRVATGHDNNRVRIWDVRSGACVMALEGHQRWVQGVAWSADGRRLASASADGTVRVWQLDTRRCLHELTEHTHWVVSVSWSSDGGLLASGSRDGTVRIWDAWYGRCVDVLRAHESWLWAMRFSADGTRLASGGEDGRALVWDVASRKQFGEMAGHSRGVWCL